MKFCYVKMIWRKQSSVYQMPVTESSLKLKFKALLPVIGVCFFADETNSGSLMVKDWVQKTAVRNLCECELLHLKDSINGLYEKKMFHMEATLIARFMGPTWGRQNPSGPHVGPTNLAIWEHTYIQIIKYYSCLPWKLVVSNCRMICNV